MPVPVGGGRPGRLPRAGPDSRLGRPSAGPCVGGPAGLDRGPDAGGAESGPGPPSGERGAAGQSGGPAPGPPGPAGLGRRLVRVDRRPRLRRRRRPVGAVLPGLPDGRPGAGLECPGSAWAPALVLMANSGPWPPWPPCVVLVRHDLGDRGLARRSVWLLALAPAAYSPGAGLRRCRPAVVLGGHRAGRPDRSVVVGGRRPGWRPGWSVRWGFCWWCRWSSRCG